MSILSDLAPENSKLPPPHQTGKPPIAAWLLAILMLSGGGIWLYWSMLHNASTTPTRAAPMQVVEGPREVRTQPSAQDQLTIEVARGSDTSSATIRNDAPTKASVSEQPSENVFQAMQKELANTPSTARPSEQSTRELAVTNQKKERSPVVVSGKSQAKASTPAKQNPKATNKRHEERDIEIISAIVK